MNTTTSFISPVVSVLGHVDHGKTTLLDAIRKSDIAGREHGGITQKIGASRVEILHDGKKHAITFIDTPGHEAFSKMRSRGSQAADIALLIVSVVDGVMPQTKESIQLLQKAGVPYIVVLTKSDSPEKNPEKVKQQLSRENVLLEGYGGDVPVIEVSARTGDNVKELLDLILLVWEMRQQTHSVADIEKQPLKAIVIESRLDPKSGPRATVVVKTGTMHVKDEIATANTQGKVRSLVTDTGAMVQQLIAGEAAEVLGFEKVPAVGSLVSTKGAIAHIEAEEKQAIPQALFEKEGKTLTLMLCADTLGSLEAIIASLPKEVYLASYKTGEISEADILMAKSIGAIILTFNTRIKPDIFKFAQTEKILVKNYTIIYEMLDEIGQVIEGKLLALMEQIYGTASVLATFPFEKTIVFGLRVIDGRIAKGDKIRILREDAVIGETQVVSLRQGKNPISKVEKGQECGILISPLLDITIGDMVICHS
ncbi:MAG: GTP-binding protein [Patescibacteria group bacterium]|nr:GTP-binding protein [Patescibacteria group bacterium]